MKDTGAPWALPYPEPGDHTRTWEYWQSLATATDTALDTLGARTIDTGRISAITGTYQTGWITHSAPIAGRRFGPFCIVEFSAKRSGTALTSPATGNITDSPMFQITDARFKIASTAALLFPLTSNLGPTGACQFVSDGTIYLSTWTANAVINTNDVIWGMLAYEGA